MLSAVSSETHRRVADESDTLYVLQREMTKASRLNHE